MTDNNPFLSGPMKVEDEWIDYNGHMNMAYYNVLFDRCADEAFETFGMGPDYARDRRLTAYAAEIHVRYRRELHAGDTVRVMFRILDHDAKRLHGYQEIRHEDGWVAATAECLWLHIDMAGPRVSPFPDDVAARIADLHRMHETLPLPDGIGRPVAIVRKPPAAS